MRALFVVLLLSAACGHGGTGLREEQERSRRYRDAYESQAQELAQLRARVVELEKRSCDGR